MINSAKRFSVVSNELPDPSYPPETKANGWSPVQDIERIISSDTWVLAEDDERPWLLRIWLEAWRSVPVGSMPADRRLFARRIGCKTAFLEAHAEILMRGWVLHSDGNLYHSFIVSQVDEMLETRHKNREKLRKWRKDQEEKEALRQKLEKEEQEEKERCNRLQGECNQLLTVTDRLVTIRKGKDRNGQEEESSSLSPSSPSTSVAADAAVVSERANPEPTPTAQAKPDSPSPRSAPKPQATSWPRFDDFWSAYPSKKAKEDARRAWHRLRLPPNVIDAILTDITDRATTDRRWLDGFIPNPATYLNGRRWEDAITPVTAIKAGGARAASLAERNAAVFDDFLRGNGTNGVIEGECQHV